MGACNTPAGARFSAVIYSLIESAKGNNPVPYRCPAWRLHNAPVPCQTDKKHGRSPSSPRALPKNAGFPKHN